MTSCEAMEVFKIGDNLEEIWIVHKCLGKSRARHHLKASSLGWFATWWDGGGGEVMEGDIEGWENPEPVQALSLTSCVTERRSLNLSKPAAPSSVEQG